MATNITAGRVGVLPSELTPDGKIKNKGEIKPATANTLGGIKVGEGLQITEDGTLSAGSTEKDIEYIIYDQPNNTIDKTLAEIKAIYESGKPVIIKSIYTNDTRYYFINNIKYETHRYYFYGLGNIGSNQSNRVLSLEVRLNNDETEIRSITLTDNQQDVYTRPADKYISYNSTTDTWSVSDINYITPDYLLNGRNTAVVTVNDGTTNINYKFIPDYYTGTSGNYTGTVHVGNMVFNYTYNGMTWTLTKQN